MINQNEFLENGYETVEIYFHEWNEETQEEEEKSLLMYNKDFMDWLNNHTEYSSEDEFFVEYTSEDYHLNLYDYLFINDIEHKIVG